MAQALLRPPTTLQPRPKANPTFSNAPLDTQTPFRTPRRSRPSSENRQPSSRKPSPVENASARATAALIRRVLCPQPTTGNNEARPIAELLPPLTSSNDVDLQLYAIIAIVVKEMVYSWYGKITSDQTFVEEVVKIIAHCTTGLEGRLRAVDVESLTCDEIPDLIENHILAYRISHGAAQTPGIIVNPRAVYHELNPHPALSPVPDPSLETSATQQSSNEANYRQLLVQGALAILLPTEDLENTSLRTLVADVIAESIVGRSLGGRVCEDWFVWTSITKLVGAVQAQVNPRATGDEIEVDTRSRLEKYGLLSERGDDSRPATDGRRSAFSEVFWRFLQYGYLTIITLRFLLVGFVASLSEPRRSSWSAKATADSPVAKAAEAPNATRRPILGFRILSLPATLVHLSFRMPWLCGALALLQHHLIESPWVLLRVGAVDGLLDQYLRHLVIGHLRHPALLPALLAAVRTNLFPRNALPPPAPDPPTAEQRAEMKRQCAEALSALLPWILSRAAGLSRQDVVTEVESDLDVWSDAYMNKHLAYQILDLVTVRILPEMGEKGVQELMEARGIGISSTS
ncbi:MAG: hypothetical protein Q9196_004220 [Gyalolechia fulgens]